MSDEKCAAGSKSWRAGLQGSAEKVTLLVKEQRVAVKQSPAANRCVVAIKASQDTRFRAMVCRTESNHNLQQRHLNAAC
jgi:hypothetical protein